MSTKPLERPMVHALTLAATDSTAAICAVQVGLAARKAELWGLDVRPLAGAFEVALRLGRLSAPDARMLSDRLAAVPGVLRRGWDING